jgi:integrase
VSITSSLPFRLWTTRLPSGEARSFLLNSLGVPDSYSTLFVTVTLRNAGKSVASQEAALNAINILYRHCDKHQIELLRRFKRGEFLDRWEVEALRSAVQQSFGPEQNALAKVIELGKRKKGHHYQSEPVATQTQRARLTYIARYLEWLANELNARRDNSRSLNAAAMCAHIYGVRPAASARGEDVDKNRFTRAQNKILNDVIEPGSDRNPFEPIVQLRNKLLVYLLRSIGKRRGEVLNIRVGDIRFSAHRIDIVRRADDPNDPRERQPLVKTNEHSIALYPELEDLIQEYLQVRREIPGTRKHPYLLVTHQACPTRGQPMTIEALRKVFRVLKTSAPALRSIHPHLLRHFHGDTMAQVQQDGSQSPESRETARRTRNWLAGRRPESEVDALYTRRAIEKEAADVSRRTQRETMRLQRVPSDGEQKQ